MTKTYPEVTIEELKIYHENPHNPRYRFQCPSCDRNYSREDNLKVHIKKSHDNESDPNEIKGTVTKVIIDKSRGEVSLLE